MREVDIKGVRKLIADGIVKGGMIPKVDCCVRSLAQVCEHHACSATPYCSKRTFVLLRMLSYPDANELQLSLCCRG